MPDQEHEGGFTLDTDPLPMENAPNDLTSGDMWWAAFTLENDVYAMYKYVTQPVFADNPSFKLVENLKASKYWERYRDNFVGVGSQEEFNWIASQIDEEEKKKEDLMASGWAGIGAAMTMGVMSPTMFIPVFAGGRGAVAVARGAALGVGAAAIQEAPLQATQQTRTAAESGLAIGSGAILGGIFGGAIAHMTPVERVAIEEAMVQSANAVPRPQAGGSAAVVQDAGGLATGGMWGRAGEWMVRLFDTNPISRSPVTASLTQTDYVTARIGMQGLADAGLTMKGNYENIVTSLGGTAENNVTVWNGRYADFIPDYDRAYNDYIYDGTPPAMFTNTRAMVRGWQDAQKMSKKQFAEEVFLAIAQKGVHENEFVKRAAEAAIKKVIEPVTQAMQEAKMLGMELPQYADPGWVMWMPSQEKLRANQAGFLDMMTKKFNENMRNDFKEKWLEVVNKNAGDEQFIRDAGLRREEIDELTANIKQQQDEVLEKMQEQHFTAIEDTVADMRLRARQLMRREGGPKLADEEYARQLNKDAKEMEEAAGTEYARLRAQAKALDKRQKNLREATVLVEERHAKKLEKIDTLEGMSERALMRVARKGQQIFKELDKWTDEKLDAELGKFRDQFERVAELYDKGEERLAKLAEGDEPLLMPGEEPTFGGVPSIKEQERLAVEQGFLDEPFEQKARPLTPEGLAELQEGFNQRLLASDMPESVKKLVGTDKFRTAYDKWVAGRKTPPAAADIVDEMDRQVPAFEQQMTERGLAIQGEEMLQTRRFDKLSQLTEKIADAEDLGRPAVREMITDMLREFNKRISGLNNRRAVRAERLRKQAETLSPEAHAKRLEAVAARPKERLRALDEWVTRTGGRLDLVDGKPEVDFADKAMEMAQATKDKFMGTMLRLPMVDMMQDLRGSALERSLGFITTKEMLPWLDTNIERVLRTYLRTMAPDIEIAKRFDSPGAKKLWDDLKTEHHTKQEVIKNDPKLDDEAKNKELARTDEVLKGLTRNLETVVRRLRNLDGLPADPDGMSYRMAKVASDLNVLRYMGNVMISSLPDPMRPVMRYGLLRVFKDAWLPFVTNLKYIKMTKREAQLAGVGLETFTGMRARGLIDIMDDLGRGSKFERGVQWATGKQGIVAGFNYWTDLNKYVAAAATNAKLMDSIGEVMTKPNPSKNTVAFLHQNGIDGARAQMIWEEVVTNGGGEKVNGVWLPNTETWKNPKAKEAYRAALAREVNNTIVTPGVERPIWTTAGPVQQLLFQFKSFGMSSTYKTLVAGLQQRDSNFLQGALGSVLLGAASYYLFGIAKGGDIEKEMREAPPERWIDEGLQRSGLLANFGFLQDFLSRIPATAPYSSFSGERTTRRGGSDILETMGGPTLDLMQRAAVVMTGIDDPTQATAHAARLMIPWQNVFYLTQAFDAVEASLDLPERRQ